jgi:hypothetical protein
MGKLLTKHGRTLLLTFISGGATIAVLVMQLLQLAAERVI